jgi:hypothetical protein
MNNDVSWVIDFRSDSDDLNLYNQILSEKWCKIHHVKDLFDGNFSEELIKLYFDNYSYRDKLRDFWDDTIIKNPKRINIFLIADNENIDNASLFSFCLKSNTLLFFNQIGLPPNSSLSCYLISYWDSSWTKEVESEKTNNLYSLNLIQNIPDIKRRPFDFVCIFKDINSGIEQFEYRNRNSNTEYFNSKICALIYHISNANQELVKKNNNINRWCISIGASLIYLDTETLYNRTAKELSNLLVNELISTENNPWEIVEDKPLQEKIKYLDFFEVFNFIKFQNIKNSSSKKTFYILDLSSIWDWFGLSKLAFFFTKDIRELLLKLKENKVNFLFETYNEMRSQVERNFYQLIDFKSNNIKTPDLIFDEYFQSKPFSFQAYRIGLEGLVKLIHKQKEQNEKNYKEFYPDLSSLDKSCYNPCNMNPEVSKKFIEISSELNNKEGLVLDEKVLNQHLKIKERAENIPHPLTLLLKTSFLGTIIVLLSYIPLLHLFPNKSWIVYFILVILFIIPFVLIWNKFKKDTNALLDLSFEYEALSKYYVANKLIDFINRKINAVYDDYLNLCKNELVKVEDKIKESEKFLKSSVENKSKYPDNFSVRSATSIAENIPPIRISIEGTHIETKDLKGNTEKLFKYFKQIVTSSNVTLIELLSTKTEELNNKIIDQLKNANENISSAADLLFPKDEINIKEQENEIILNLLSPFNNGSSNLDNLSREILLDSYRMDDDKLINNFFNKGINTSILRYKSQNNNKELTVGAISILNINQPINNVFGLFSTSLGGNKSSFIQITERFNKVCHDKFTNFLEKVIYETIVIRNITTTDKREEVFSSVMKGFDLNFDENGWQTYFTDVESIEESYIKNFRKMFKEKFEYSLSKYLNSKDNK